MAQHLKPDQRYSQLLHVAVELANHNQTVMVTQLDVANAAQVSVPTVRKYFKDKSTLWAAIARDPAANEAVRASARLLRVS